MSDVGVDYHKIRIWMAKTRPHIAKTMIYTGRILNVAGTVSGDNRFSILGNIFGGLAKLVIKTNKKNVSELCNQLACDEINDEMSPEAMELLDMLSVSQEQLMDTIAKEFKEVKEILEVLTEKVDKILDMVTEIYHANGLKRILTVHNDMIAKEKHLDEWALNFHQDIANFTQVLSDFKKENITGYLKMIYKQKCSDSLDPMFETFKLILEVRYLYLNILVTYYSNYPTSLLVNLPNFNPAERVMDEIEKAEKEVIEIQKAANDALGGFFMAAYTSKLIKQKIKIVYIPDYHEILKSKDAFKLTNWEKLAYGISFRIFLTKNLQTYKQQDGNFIWCKDEQKTEYIHKLDKDGVTVEDGIYQKRNVEKDTEIGTYIFSKKEEEVDKHYCLHRSSSTGVVEYRVEEKKRGEKVWKLLEMNEFDPQTVSWIFKRNQKINDWLDNNNYHQQYKIETWRTDRVLQIVEKATQILSTTTLSQEIVKFGLGAVLEEIKGSSATPKSKEVINSLSLSKKLIKQNLKHGLEAIQVKNWQLLDTESQHKIMNVYKDMVLAKDSQAWAVKFSFDITGFREVLKGFERTKITSFLSKVYKENCSTSMDAMYEAFGFILQSRLVLTHILVTYYSNIPQRSLNLDRVESVMLEIQASEIAVTYICGAAEDVFSGFFMAAITSDPAWNLDLAYLPKLAEIPKNDDTFWKESTVGDVMVGDASRNQDKVKLYRNNNSKFVRAHDEDNHEYIHVIDDNGQLKNGIYSYTFPSMDTSIGSRYFRRGDRKEDRDYRLYRFNKSGNIIYTDKIQGKGEDWRLLTQYKYKPESLSWVKVK